MYVSTKNNVQHESCKLSSVWGKTKTSLRESISDSSEKQLQRGSGEMSGYM